MQTNCIKNGTVTYIMTSLLYLLIVSSPKLLQIILLLQVLSYEELSTPKRSVETIRKLRDSKWYSLKRAAQITFYRLQL